MTSAPGTVQQTAICEACRAPMQRDEAVERAIGKPAEQPLWFCAACGHRQVAPIPDLETIVSYYNYSPEDVARHGIQHDWTAGTDRIAPTYARRLKRVWCDRLRGAELLDVGYGNGMFLRAAYKMGFRVTGIDPDSRFFEPDFPCRLSQRHLARDVFPNESFDVIAAHHVLEHVANVEETVGTVFELLKPGGYFLVELPHEIRSLIKRLRRTLTNYRYTYRSIYQHLRYYSSDSLALMLSRHGFRVLRCRSIAGCEFLRYPKAMMLWPIAPLERLTDSGIFLEAIAQKPG